MNRCPSEDELNKALASTQPDTESDRVMVHVEDCSACQSRVESWFAKDETLDEIRKVALAPPPRSPAFDQASVPRGLDDSERASSSAIRSNFASDVVKRLGDRDGSFGRYRIKGEIARGGQGAVLQVWDEDLRRNLAMKVVLERPERNRGDGGEPSPHDSNHIGRFLEEAQITSQLDHPGIVPVHELGLDSDGRLYFTMKLVKGRDLSEVLEMSDHGEEGWSRTRALGAMLRVCDALAYAHSKGVIHRDLKPSNVMVGRFGEVYVMDWGLARIQGQEDLHDVRPAAEGQSISVVESDRHTAATDSPGLVTMDGSVVGTPVYMAPEQASGRVSELDSRADVYSVGAMLYRLIAGRPPYAPKNAKVSARSVLWRVIEGPPEPLDSIAPDAPPELVAITERAMAREASDRYPEIEDLANDLRAYLENRVVRAYETGAVAELRKWVRRNKGMAALAAAVVVIAFAALGSVSYVEATGRHVAEELEKIARTERSNVLRLSAFSDLDQLARDADSLWPAHPDNELAFEAWLARARDLVLTLEPDPTENHPGHRASLQKLRARALPRTAEDDENDRRAHPKYDELTRLEQKLAALALARDVRAGTAEVPVVHLDEETLPTHAAALSAMAFELVEPGRARYGQEARGLAMARFAMDRVENDQQLYETQRALAWALFANGLHEEALVEIAGMISVATDIMRNSAFDESLVLKRAVIDAETDEELESVRQRWEALEGLVSSHRIWRFPTTEESWWHAQLTELVESIEAFGDPETGLIDGFSGEHGWGVARRLAWAQSSRERTVDGRDATRRWTEAIASISDREECPLYDGLTIEPQLGLLPLGPDPASGLWEFAHPLSGRTPTRDENGRLEFDGTTGIVFVLVPGGEFWMGAQSRVRGARNHDPGAVENERPVHRVQLAPFFLSKFEMTQGQWISFTGWNPSGNNESRNSSFREYPVETVTWFASDRTLTRMGLRLPSEAQWEYAARGGTSTCWWSGDDRDSLDGAANVADSSWRRNQGQPVDADKDWLDDTWAFTAPVNRFRENPFGLGGLHGNVHEWCVDRFDERAYAKSRLVEPLLEPIGDESRVVRDAGFQTLFTGARVARRVDADPESNDSDRGLRPARALNGAWRQPAADR